MLFILFVQCFKHEVYMVINYYRELKLKAYDALRRREQTILKSSVNKAV